MTFFYNPNSYILFKNERPIMNYRRAFFRGKFLSMCRATEDSSTVFFIFTSANLYKLCTDSLILDIYWANKGNETFYTPREDSSSIVHNNYLYLIGGTTNEKLQESIFSSNDNPKTIKKIHQNMCQKFDFSRKKWKYCSPLNIPRSSCSIVSFNSCIYVLGGYSLFLLSSVEKYFNKVWICMKFHLPSGLYNFSVIPGSYRRLLIVGGKSSSTGICMSKVYDICVDTGEIGEICELNTGTEITACNALLNGTKLEFLDNMGYYVVKELNSNKWKDVMPVVLVFQYLHLSLK